MSCLVQEIDLLMEEWATRHRDKGWANFISDGVVNAEAYEKSGLKICFFLKEAYTKEEDWSLTEWLNTGAITKMWGRVAEWTYGIRNVTITDIPTKPQLTREQKAELIKSIAVVNVKKSNGNIQSDYADLLQYAVEDCNYLKREMDMLKPDVIVCGNNSSLLRLLYGAEVTDKNKVSMDGIIDAEYMRKNGYAFLGNQIIIDYYHPANQYPSMLNYYTVCSLYQQALKRKVR